MTKVYGNLLHFMYLNGNLLITSTKRLKKKRKKAKCSFRYYERSDEAEGEEQMWAWGSGVA